MTTKRLLTNTALSALLGAVPTILAVLASVAGISACACGGKWIERNSIDEKNGQHDLSQDGIGLVRIVTPRLFLFFLQRGINVHGPSAHRQRPLPSLKAGLFELDLVVAGRELQC